MTTQQSDRSLSLASIIFNKEVEIWIPAHSNIQENEKTGRLAKKRQEECNRWIESQHMNKNNEQTKSHTQRQTDKTRPHSKYR